MVKPDHEFYKSETRMAYRVNLLVDVSAKTPDFVKYYCSVMLVSIGSGKVWNDTKQYLPGEEDSVKIYIGFPNLAFEKHEIDVFYSSLTSDVKQVQKEIADWIGDLKRI
jgi:hypothetical protein